MPNLTPFGQKVGSVPTSLMTDAAKALLLAHGVDASADEMTDKILNRAKTGLCPMETRVKDLSDVDAMVQILLK